MKYRLAKKKIKASAIVRLWIQSCHQSETAWREAQYRRDSCSEKILAFYEQSAREPTTSVVE